jgi:carboxypeptidase C (cathepsin A)
MFRILVLAIAFTAIGAFADTTTQPADPTARTTTRPATTQAGEKGDRISVTSHSINLNGKGLKYTATAGTMAQKDETGATKADMFFVAYTVDGDGVKLSDRPITFIFNGGPGAASVWLHLGTAGPRRIDIDDNAPARPPFKLVENEASWLDASDLVFIDPVGTGYSRPAKDEKGEQFYGVQEDVKSVASFIRLYTTRYHRWRSPKFLAGESYGTTRAAGLSEYLLDKQGISLNGIVLISSVLSFQTIVPNPGNDLPFPLYLPSYTATAWYHKKLAGDLQADLTKTLKEVEQFALTDYLAALARGDDLPDALRQEIAQKLSRYTSLPVDWLLKANLRIDPGRFRKTLLADERKVVGRFDSRVTGFVSDQIDDNPEYDPSLSLFLPLYTATLNDYVRGELNFESDLPYEVLTERVQPWNFGNKNFGYLYVADTLAGTMLKNPQLKVLFATGQMDLATPYFSADYTAAHMDLPPQLHKNITREVYPAGHMLYHDAASRQKLHDDIARFIESATAK